MRERNDRGNSGPFSEERIVPGTGTSMTMSTLRRRSVIGVELLEPAVLGERPESALGSRWATTRRMGEDAPLRPLPRVSRGGLGRWRADIHIRFLCELSDYSAHVDTQCENLNFCNCRVSSSIRDRLQ
jgi:hypothetical protein